MLRKLVALSLIFMLHVNKIQVLYLLSSLQMLYQMQFTRKPLRKLPNLLKPTQAVAIL